MEITLTKTEAAERQLRQAIRLFFGEGDEVSTHTLVCAAAGVLRGLSVQRGTESPVREAAAMFVRPEKLPYFYRVVQAPQNFFKHADRDPDESLTFSPEATIWLLFDACVMHSRLMGYHTPETYMFFTWVYLKHPDMMLDGTVRDFFTSPLAKSFDNDQRWAVLAAIDFMRRTKGDRIPIPTTTPTAG